MVVSVWWVVSGYAACRRVAGGWGMRWACVAFRCCQLTDRYSDKLLKLGACEPVGCQHLQHDVTQRLECDHAAPAAVLGWRVEHLEKFNQLLWYGVVGMVCEVELGGEDGGVGLAFR